MLLLAVFGNAYVWAKEEPARTIPSDHGAMVPGGGRARPSPDHLARVDRSSQLASDRFRWRARARELGNASALRRKPGRAVVLLDPGSDGSPRRPSPGCHRVRAELSRREAIGCARGRARDDRPHRRRAHRDLAADSGEVRPVYLLQTRTTLPHRVAGAGHRLRRCERNPGKTSRRKRGAKLTVPGHRWRAGHKPRAQGLAAVPTRHARAHAAQPSRVLGDSR